VRRSWLRGAKVARRRFKSISTSTEMGLWVMVSPRLNTLAKKALVVT
jgi:hypothetical protein